MTKDDDNKPVISLAAKRDEQQRNFAKERSEILKEASELGLSDEEATAVAHEVMLCGLFIYKAFVSLDHWDSDVSGDAVVKLAGIMRQGIGDRLKH
jgi:hypothetical protein